MPSKKRFCTSSMAARSNMCFCSRLLSTISCLGSWGYDSGKLCASCFIEKTHKIKSAFRKFAFTVYCKIMISIMRNPSGNIKAKNVKVKVKDPPCRIYRGPINADLFIVYSILSMFLLVYKYL